jgi:hypothetical protein
VDAQWTENAPKDYPHDEDLADRLSTAYTHLSKKWENENSQRALQSLLRFGLVVDVPDPSSPQHSLPHYVTRTILNHCIAHNQPCPFKFSMRLSDSPDATSMDIHARSRLVLSFLARHLNVTIYLFSSRAKARVFKSEGSRVSFGLVHLIDSYTSTSEYLVLAKSRHHPRMMVDPLPTPSFSGEYSPASYRLERRRPDPQRSMANSDITKDDCDRALRLAW